MATRVPSVTDVATRRHLQDAREVIAATLDPRAMRTRVAAAGAGGGRGGGPGLAARGPYVLDSTRYDAETDPFLQPAPDSGTHGAPRRRWRPRPSAPGART